MGQPPRMGFGGVCAGAAGQPLRCRNARIMCFHQHGRGRGQATDIEIQACEIFSQLRSRLNRYYVSTRAP